MEYRMMAPPFEVKAFEEMSKKEAQKNFDWFVNEIPDRIGQLDRYYKLTNGAGSLDYEPESLKNLWEWFVQHLELVKKSKEEMKEEKRHLPEQFRNIIKVEDVKLSLQTQMLVVDVAIYFGEVFAIKHNLKWGFVTQPKQLVYLNKPVIIGFGLKHLEPIMIVQNLVRKTLRGESSPKLLLEIYEVWRGHISN
ncbi:hypothetical protein [Tumebacillus flagellatus]|uniref:Uncharacterized protein n=1 Tax=Tumebacillus flagellatus TaxID=1157490 RepID=A0A074LG42_9BACL|nr:hypothetical protein [Tumebacillus flagellatus]KEO81191.1 hypothetical protein EL26_22310 [Tumebacillus flagellatus]